MAFRFPIRDPKQKIAVRYFGGTEVLSRQLGRSLRVVHLTDQHFGRVTSEALQWAAADLANESEPDLVVLTGDYVAHSLNYLGQLTEVLRSIQAPMVGVLGNHDHWAGARQVRGALERAGVEVLANECVVREFNGQALQLVGLDDAYTGHADARRALASLDGDLPSLGLSHIAEEAEKLWSHGVSLVLSGHTHSGQITVGNLHHWTLGRALGHRYVHGLYGSSGSGGEERSGSVYVSAGIGASVFGLRLGERARPELPIFNLGEPAETFDLAAQAPHSGRAPSEKTQLKRQYQVEKKRRSREKQLRRHFDYGSK